MSKLRAVDFDPQKFTNGSLYADESVLSDYRADNPDPVPLLYQTGYLTITGYDGEFMSYELGYPNNEVRYGFLKSLAPMYLNQNEVGPLDVRSFVQDVRNARLESLHERLTAILAGIPYPSDAKLVEQNFEVAVYLIFSLMGQYVKTEVHSAKGRADCIVETDDYIYIFEFKRDGSAEEALAQIETQGYALPYVADKRKLFKIGVNFDSEKRTIAEWRVEARHSG